MDPPLGLAGIFMVELERSLVKISAITLNFGSGFLMTLSHFEILKLLITI